MIPLSLAMILTSSSPSGVALPPMSARRVAWSADTGMLTDLAGNALDLGVRPQNDAEFITMARALVAEYTAILGVTAAELVDPQVRHLELARVGSSDKVSVEFAQACGGLRVRDASINFLFDATGRWLALQNHSVPGVASLSLTPSVSLEGAERTATSAFGRPLSRVLAAQTVLIRGQDGRAQLAHVIELQSTGRNGGVPAQERYEIDAHTGVVVRHHDTVFHFTDLTGNVDGWASPGPYPDNSKHPEELAKLDSLHLTSPVGDTDTTRNGDFVIPYGFSAPQDVTADFGDDNTRCWVINHAGPDLTLTTPVIPGVPAQITLNDARDEYGTAQVNAFVWSRRMHRLVTDIDPHESAVDFQIIANVNSPDDCAPAYSGHAIFFSRDGYCVNASYASVIAHEIGHWYTDRFGSTAFEDGFHDGAADTWAMYVVDDPEVGKEWSGLSAYWRTGNNDRQYDGTCGGDCFLRWGECGEVLMGALWKVRDRLNRSLGDTAGDAVADQLLVRWFQAFNDEQICPQIELHWLVLDDDDGNMTNGTPHYYDIDRAFRQQGFPGLDLPWDCVKPTNYGTGTAGAGGVPHISAPNPPRLGAYDFILHAEPTRKDAPALLAVGAAKASLDYRSTEILVDIIGPHLLIPAHTTSGGGSFASGRVDLTLPLPSDPGLDGLEFYCQYLIFDTAAASGLAASEGLDAILCCGC